eukprot:14761522-Heterocapsa_arctica.AAC.1
MWDGLPRNNTNNIFGKSAPTIFKVAAPGASARGCKDLVFVLLRYTCRGPGKRKEGEDLSFLASSTKQSSCQCKSVVQPGARGKRETGEHGAC